MARPKKIINWSDVEKLCAIQCTQEEIAHFCDCTVDTLNSSCKRENGMSFSEFFQTKRGSGRISLRRAQWQLAHKGNATMLIWLGKQYLEQHDKHDTQITGANGQDLFKSFTEFVRDVAHEPAKISHDTTKKN